MQSARVVSHHAIYWTRRKQHEERNVRTHKQLHTYSTTHTYSHTHTEKLFVFFMDSLNNIHHQFTISYFPSTNKVSFYLNFVLLS